jgi:predicted hydrolase (HD superfamily)
MNEENPKIVDRFQLVVNTWEVLNAYSELTDPVDQKERFMQQAEYKTQGDEEAMMVDFGFIEAMEHGFPPMAGFGMGIERLMCLLFNQENLRDVVLFPMTKPSQEEINLMKELGQEAKSNSNEKDDDIEVGFSREDAIKMIEKYVDPKLQPHLYFVEAAMRGLADHFGYSEQKDTWGLLGLVHDIDWSLTEEETMSSNPLAHCGEKLDEILGEINATPEFIEAVRSHYDQHKLPLDSDMKKALFAVDELCGFIVAVTLVRPSKLMNDVKVSSVMKKFKDKGFAAKVDRSLILTCEENLKTPIKEFVELTLTYMKEIASKYGM